MIKRFLATALFIILILLLSGAVLSEGFLPDLNNVYGVEVPSFTDVIGKYPDSISVSDKETTYLYTEVTDEHYYTYGNVLQEAGCEVDSYSVTGAVVEVVIAYKEKLFSFSYDSENATMTILYPEKVSDSPEMTPTPTPEPVQTQKRTAEPTPVRTQTSASTPAPTLTPAPTDTPNPTQEPTPTPEPTSTPSPEPTQTPKAVNWTVSAGYSIDTGENRELWVSEKESIQIKATVQSEDGEKHGKIRFTWGTSDETIATVTENGKVTGVSAGDVIITCRSLSDLEVYSLVFVHVVTPVKSITLDRTKAVLLTHCTKQDKDQTDLFLTIEPENAAYEDIQWQSSDESIAMVDQSGHVTAIAEGKVRISAVTSTLGSGKQIKAVCDIDVVKAVKSINGSWNNTTLLGIGKTMQISMEAKPSDAGIKKLYWESENPEIATVDQNGKVKGISKGKTNIVCSTTDGSEIVRHLLIEIVPPTKSLKATQKYILFKENEKVDLSKYYVVEPLDAHPELTWSIKFTGDFYSAAAGVEYDGAKRVLVSYYSNCQFGDYPVTLTGTTKDGTNKSISFEVYVLPSNGNTLFFGDGDIRWKEMPRDELSLSFSVQNFKYGKEVDAFEISVAATDYQGKNVFGAKKCIKGITNKRLAPGSKLYSAPLIIGKRSHIKELKWWISGIWYSDGQYIEITEENSNVWSSWDSAYFPWH